MIEIIHEKINKLKIGADIYLTDTLETLEEQLVSARENTWDPGELAENIKSDCDALDFSMLDDDSQIYQEIREIQDGIINYYG